MPSHVTSSTLKLFADNSLLYNPIHHPGDLSDLQEDINSLFTWSENSQINFNTSKCQLIRIDRGNSTLPISNYSMSSETIASVDSVKYLGVTIDERLSFNNHISEICSKRNRTLTMLMRNLKKAKRKTRILAYKTVCCPKLEYASQVWWPHLQKHINCLEAINRRAFR